MYELSFFLLGAVAMWVATQAAYRLGMIEWKGPNRD